MKTARMTRRKFLANSAVAISAPMVVPSSVLGKGDSTAPSERIVMGGIAIGGRGRGDLGWLLRQKDVQFVTVCDVQKKNRLRAKGMIDRTNGNKDCVAYRDFRELLAERTDLDAVLMAPGDRWHAPMSVLAMKAGLDVYSEKPGSMTVAEGQTVVRTANRYARVFQTGTQRMSEAKFVFATELARKGFLGKLHTVRAHLWSTVKDVTYNKRLPAQPEPPKEEVDWDIWLGPAPWRPYNRSYLGGCGAWGIYSDFGAGVAGWGSHTFVQCQAAIAPECPTPVKYVYPGNSSGDGMVVTFANGVKLILSFGGWRGTCGVKFEGSEGWTSVADGYARPDVSSPALLGESDRLTQNYAAENKRPFNHLRDFLDCVKTRRSPVADAGVMHRSMTTNHVINACLKLRRDLEWDPVKEEFVNDEEANRLLSRAYRAPWLA